MAKRKAKQKKAVIEQYRECAGKTYEVHFFIEGWVMVSGMGGPDSSAEHVRDNAHDYLDIVKSAHRIELTVDEDEEPEEQDAEDEDEEQDED